MFEVTITTDQKVRVTITPKTAKDEKAVVDGVPTWSVVDGDATLDIAADGYSAWLISSDTPGDTEFLVEADADLGEGTETISTNIMLHVFGAKAANLGVVFETPVLKQP